MTLLGEFLKGMPKRGPEHSRGGGTNGSKREPLPDAPPSLADAGIGKKESSDAQALHSIKDAEPDLYEQVRDGETTIPKARSEVKARHRKREKRKALEQNAVSDPPVLRLAGKNLVTRFLLRTA